MSLYRNKIDLAIPQIWRICLLTLFEQSLRDSTDGALKQLCVRRAVECQTKALSFRKPVMECWVRLDVL